MVGFGGANAHAILEQHELPTSSSQESAISFTPFVFSALTETSLVAFLERLIQVLQTRPDSIDVSDLAWTLHSRRSQLPTRVAFSTSTIQQLSENIDSKLAAPKQNAGSAIGSRSGGKPPPPRVLGIFTGQGAQWPSMGARLIRSSSFVRQKIQNLKESLATLPPADRPTWCLREEILAGADTSRISEAALSQPLCTAIQIVLVDLLQTAGITFASVVGHSSGEIAAAYDAGFLSAHDTIRIAYYRGLYARLASNKANGQEGAMLAAGISWVDAQELVNLQAFKGRLAVAAHNSSAGVTFAGDAAAILHAKKLLDEQKKFTSLLTVDNAYHSHHMLPCGDPYVNALRGCGIRSNHDRKNTCTWFSSVIPSAKSMEPVQELQDEYWRDNMTNAVLFSDAVKNAVSSDEQINIVLEIGPHPALKGPSMQNIANVRPNPLPWDHRKIHWSESHRSKKIRGQKDSPHELLGILSPESNGRDMRWSNILKVSEIPWMEGHQLQGLVVFPAAGYIAMAIEACRILAGDKTVELFELHNLSIPSHYIRRRRCIWCRDSRHADGSRTPSRPDRHS